MTNQEYTEVLEEMIVSLTGIELPQLHEAVSNRLNETNATAVMDRVTAALADKKRYGSHSAVSSKYGGSGADNVAIAHGRLSGLAARVQDRINRQDSSRSSGFRPRSADRSAAAPTGVDPLISNQYVSGLRGDDVARLPTSDGKTVTHGDLRGQRDATIALRNRDSSRGAKGSNGLPLPVRRTSVDRADWIGNNDDKLDLLRNKAKGNG